MQPSQTAIDEFARELSEFYSEVLGEPERVLHPHDSIDPHVDVYFYHRPHAWLLVTAGLCSKEIDGGRYEFALHLRPECDFDDVRETGDQLIAVARLFAQNREIPNWEFKPLLENDWADILSANLRHKPKFLRAVYTDPDRDRSTYDDLDACDYVHQRLANHYRPHEREQIKLILESFNDYQSTALTGEQPELDPDAAADHICATTGLSRCLVDDVLIGQFAYTASLGHVPGRTAEEILADALGPDKRALEEICEGLDQVLGEPRIVSKIPDWHKLDRDETDEDRDNAPIRVRFYPPPFQGKPAWLLVTAGLSHLCYRNPIELIQMMREDATSQQLADAANHLALLAYSIVDGDFPPGYRLSVIDEPWTRAVQERLWGNPRLALPRRE